MALTWMKLMHVDREITKQYILKQLNLRDTNQWARIIWWTWNFAHVGHIQMFRSPRFHELMGGPKWLCANFLDKHVLTWEYIYIYIYIVRLWGHLARCGTTYGTHMGPPMIHPNPQAIVVPDNFGSTHCLNQTTPPTQKIKTKEKCGPLSSSISGPH